MYASQILFSQLKIARGSYVHFTALRRYKDIYSNLLVPINFVIGTEDKSLWPETMYGYTLGEHVRNVRYKLKKNFYPESVVKELDRMGFVRDTRVNHANDILLAFKTFVEKNGHGNVPHGFKIDKMDLSWPKQTRGIDLSATLVRIRNTEIFTHLKDKLLAIGVPVDQTSRSYEFEYKFAALQKYKEIHGHVNIPMKFVIAKDDTRFPEEARGLSLGSWLFQVRCSDYHLERRQRLQDLGVEFVSDFEWVSFDVIKTTLEAFQTVYGHNRLHPSFVVPSGDVRFPEEMWGEPLLDKIRKLNLWKQVKSLGFIEAFEVPKVDFEVVLEALQIYKAQRGHLLVPAKFKVDDSEKGWPKHLLGLTLGSRVTSLRIMLGKNLLSEDVVKKLDELGFVRSLPQTYANRVLLAFQAYHTKFGNFKIPETFRIDEEDEGWPEQTRGIPLGKSLNNMRRQAGYLLSIRNQVEALGVDLKRQRKTNDFERNFAALLVYKKIHGVVNIPTRFVVPLDDDRYAEEARGVRLGSWLAGIRREANYRRYRQRLIDIGVDLTTNTWTDSSIPFDELMKTLETFKTVYGHQNIHPTFVVPADDERFPEIMWGVELGKRIRNWRYWKDIKALGFTNLKSGKLAIDVSELQQWITQEAAKSSLDRK